MIKCLIFSLRVQFSIDTCIDRGLGVLEAMLMHMFPVFAVHTVTLLEGSVEVSFVCVYDEPNCL